MKDKRFYVAKSMLYGVTVYDREDQCPAFQYGAEMGMDDVAASVLAVRLNGALRRGLLYLRLVSTEEGMA